MGTPVCTDGHRYRFKTKHQPLFYLPSCRLSLRHFFLAIIFVILTLLFAKVYISPTPLFLRRFVIQDLNGSDLPNINGYVILPSNPCRERDVELVICVTGSRGNAEIRNTIRETWGSYSKSGIGGKMIEIGVERERDRKKRILSEYDVKSNVFNKTYNVVLLFFIGSAPSSDLSDGRWQQIQIQDESQAFGDIVQRDFEDTYRNLSLKSVSLLKWVSSYCPDTKYVLKVDDDMYVNIPLLLHALHVRTELLQKSSSTTLSKSSVLSPPPPTHTTNSTSSTDHHLVPPPDFIVGSIHHNGSPHRHNSSKWYTPADVFDGSRYPEFTSGTAYAMTGGAAKRLYKASVLLQRTFWLEDVYITGICAKEAGVRVHEDNRFHLYKPRLSGCYFRRHISGHRITAREIQKIHKDVLSKNLKCLDQEPP